MPKIRVERAVGIQAPPERVFATLRDFKQWPAWSPWFICEPDCSLSYSDDGDSYSWEGKVIGSGQMTVTGEEANRSIDCDLQFFKPWKSQAKVKFELIPQGEGCRVIWAMDSSLPFFMFWMKSMMTAFIGMDYERGLGMLKDLMETGSVPSKLEFLGEDTLPGFSYVGIKTLCAIQEIGPTMESDLKQLSEWFKEKGVEASGAPLCMYHAWKPVKGLTEYTIGLPVATLPEAGDSAVVDGTRQTSPVYVIRHTGPYRHLGNAWSAGMCRGRAKVITQNKNLHPMEIYNSDPCETPEHEIQTTLYFPLKA